MTNQENLTLKSHKEKIMLQRIETLDENKASRSRNDNRSSRRNNDKKSQDKMKYI